MKFQQVLDGLLAGKRYRRAGWVNALFIFLVPGSTFTVSRAPLLGIFPEGTEVAYAPHIDVVSATSNNGVQSVSTWSPWMGDLLADDWMEVATDVERANAEAEVQAQAAASSAPEAETVADASPDDTATAVEAALGSGVSGQAQAA